MGPQATEALRLVWLAGQFALAFTIGASLVGDAVRREWRSYRREGDDE